MCTSAFEHPQALQNHYCSHHQTTIESDDDTPSSPTKRPRSSFSPVQSKKRIRIVREEDNDVVEETDDEIESGDDITQLARGMNQLQMQQYSALELIHPDELAAAQLAIEPHWKITICKPCGYAVPRSMLIHHYGKHHNRSKVLPEDLDVILDTVFEDATVVKHVECPVNIVAPIQSIPIVPGVRCLIQGCGYATKTMQSTLSNHVYKKHKGHGCEVLEHCNVQWVYRTPPQYWAVEPNYSTFAGESTNIVDYLEEIKELDRQGLVTGQIQMPVNERLVTPFLSAFSSGRRLWMGKILLPFTTLSISIQKMTTCLC
jgi:hypothetical protein